jgi:anti-anti-sigma factor
MEGANMRYTQVKLEGNLIFSAPLAKQKLKEAVSKQFVELDFSNVDFVDSIGINMILDLAKNLKQKHGGLKLIGVKPNIVDTLKTASVDEVVEIVAGESAE